MLSYRQRYLGTDGKVNKINEYSVFGRDRIAQEPAVAELLNIPPHWAVATIMSLGKPLKQLTRLKRKPVEDILYTDSWNGDNT